LLFFVVLELCEHFLAHTVLVFQPLT